MWNFKGWRGLSGGADDHRGKLLLSKTLLLLLCMLLTGGLAACGAVSTGRAAHTTKVPLTPTLASTIALTSTPVPTVAPRPTVPTTPALSTTAILDVRPSSMSIVGHLDCTQSSTSYTCMAEVLALSSNQGSLSWLASTTVPGNVVFHPASGVLAPGQNILITITVPVGDCTQGLFVFHGPANTHTISWAC